MIGYVTVGSASDLRAWSGLNANIHGSLCSSGLDCVVVENLGTPRLWWPRLKARFFRQCLRQDYALERESSAAQYWARRVHQRLSNTSITTVVSPSSLPLAYLPASYRTAIWADATFHSLTTTYPQYACLCKESRNQGDRLEAQTFHRASLVCFASEWAGADARDYYGVPREKTLVIPFGANCSPAFVTDTDVITCIRGRSREFCHLVFMGVEWERKGGPLILEVVECLQKRRIPVRLTIAGCIPPLSSLPAGVDSIGFLNKQNPAEHYRWETLMRSAHFLIVPSIAECYGLVYAEASAFAVPSLARRTGGVSSVISHGANGFLFPVEAEADVYAETVANLWNDEASYTALAVGSYREWQHRLNWQVAGGQFVNALRTRGLI